MSATSVACADPAGMRAGIKNGSLGHQAGNASTLAVAYRADGPLRIFQAERVNLTNTQGIQRDEAALPCMRAETKVIAIVTHEAN
jgi:hypothetical protein